MVEVSLFGSGPVAARMLRDRILAGLVAEPEWTETGEAVACWTSGPATTFFLIEDGPQGAPDLGVLRVVTPITTVADRAAALGYCNELNLYATTNRWTVSLGEYDGAEADLLRVSCSFVVGPHSIDVLAAFAQWCVREQIATATAKMTSDIANLVGGKPCVFFGHEGGPYRKSDNWHEVVYHYDRVVSPNRDLPGEPLGIQFNEALRVLVGEMLDEGTGGWFSAGLDDPGPYTTYETPFAWGKYPDGVISASDGGNVRTALVETLFGAHPHIGSGLLITMRAPVTLTADDALEAVNALNLLDAEIAGATHSVGGWFAKGLEPTYVIYLPAVLANEAHGIEMPAIMRELQLTLARQALLARSGLLAEDELDDFDRNGPGLRVTAAAHGLAWGETGEGRNYGALFLSRLYDGIVGEDAQWADTRPDGFTWWPHEQAQEVTVVPYHADGGFGAGLYISTEVRRSVPRSGEALLAIARLNAELSQSALLLRDDGRLDLACRIFVNTGIDWWARQWVAGIAAEQFITASALAAAQLADLGESATSAHPRSGPRTQPDQLFTLREDVLIEAAGNIRWGLRPVVGFLGMVGQYALPYQLEVGEDGELDFTWRPSHSRYKALADPAIRVNVKVTDTSSGPGWLVRSWLPLTGDAEARACWCNASNLELIGTLNAGDLTAIGGFGLDSGGECVVSMWLSPFFVEDSTPNAAGLVNSLLRYQQSFILTALSAAAPLLTATPLTAGELADSLRTLVGEVCVLLGDIPGDYGWSVAVGDDCAVVTLSGTSRDEEPLAQLTSIDHSAEAASEPEEENSEPTMSLRTALRIPCGYNRPELSLLYAALLGHSTERPAEQDGIPSAQQIYTALSELEHEGVLRHEDDAEWNDGWSFSAGDAMARLETDIVRYGRGPIESALRMYDSYAPRLSGVIGKDVDPPAPQAEDSLAGTWYGRRDGSTSYEVIVAPTNFVWVADYMAVEALTWLIRHIVDRVQAAASLRSPTVGRRKRASRAPAGGYGDLPCTGNYWKWLIAGDKYMDDHSVYCPECMRQTPHVKARAGIIMCMICRHERPWNTTGWL